MPQPPAAAQRQGASCPGLHLGLGSPPSSPELSQAASAEPAPQAKLAAHLGPEAVPGAAHSEPEEWGEGRERKEGVGRHGDCSAVSAVKKEKEAKRREIALEIQRSYLL